MADACFDVFLLNTRGNCYSRRHAYLNPNAEFGEFWNFSWDQAAFHDFPCVFNYIRSITNQKKFFYIGHSQVRGDCVDFCDVYRFIASLWSQGTSQILAFLSRYPKWNEQFHAISLMAPVAFVSNPKLFFLIARILGLVVHRVMWKTNSKILKLVQLVPFNDKFELKNSIFRKAVSKYYREVAYRKCLDHFVRDWGQKHAWVWWDWCRGKIPTKT